MPVGRLVEGAACCEVAVRAIVKEPRSTAWRKLASLGTLANAEGAKLLNEASRASLPNESHHFCSVSQRPHLMQPASLSGAAKSSNCLPPWLVLLQETTLSIGQPSPLSPRR